MLQQFSAKLLESYLIIVSSKFNQNYLLLFCRREMLINRLFEPLGALGIKWISRSSMSKPP